MSEVESLLEAQILRATERENALEKKFAAFEELASKNQEASNSKIADLKQQVESLKSALGGIGKPFDDGYGGSGVSFDSTHTHRHTQTHTLTKAPNIY